jgi:hypothetical protein
MDFSISPKIPFSNGLIAIVRASGVVIDAAPVMGVDMP